MSLVILVMWPEPFKQTFPKEALHETLPQIWPGSTQDHHLCCCMPSFKNIGLLVLNKILRVFTIYMAITTIFVKWPEPFILTISFVFSMEAPGVIWLRLAKRYQRRSCLSIADKRKTTDGRQSMGILIHVSSHCEPHGSGRWASWLKS